MSNTAPRSRRPAGETRALLLDAAIERVTAQGLTVDYSNIQIEDLIRTARVPRSTVFRIWPDRGAFVADLVRALFDADPGFNTGFDEETLRLLNEAMTGAGADMRTAAGRRAGLHWAIHLAVSHNIAAVEDSVAWRAYRSLSSALAGGGPVPGGTEIRELLTQIERRYVDRMAPMYLELNRAFSIRMRPGLTERDLALAIMAMIDGMSDHRRIDPEMVDAPRTVALGPQEPRAWHLASVAVAGIYDAFTEDAAA